MTVPIESTTIVTATVVQGFSRYQNSEVIYWGDQNLLAFGTYIRTAYVPTGTEKVIMVTPGLAYRPDLLSADYYGTSDAWWKILEVNGIYDIYDFKPGITVMLPASLL
jgi:hypothetical protein